MGKTLNSLFAFLALIAFSSTSVTAQSEELTLGSTANLGALPLIAINEGLFPSHQLKVNYTHLQTGKMTMDALIGGDIEVGTIVDSNVAFIGYLENPIKVIASLGVKEDDAIYFRPSTGIANPLDLKGKRIGYIPATTSHIMLARFLARTGLK